MELDNRRDRFRDDSVDGHRARLNVIRLQAVGCLAKVEWDVLSGLASIGFRLGNATNGASQPLVIGPLRVG